MICIFSRCQCECQFFSVSIVYFLYNVNALFCFEFTFSSILAFIFIFFLLNFLYLFVAALGLCCCVQAFSSCSKQGPLSGCSAGVLIVEHRLECAGSVVVAHGLSCPATRGIFWDQELNPCRLHGQVGSQLLDHQGSPVFIFWHEFLLCQLLFHALPRSTPL